MVFRDTTLIKKFNTLLYCDLQYVNYVTEIISKFYCYCLLPQEKIFLRERLRRYAPFKIIIHLLFRPNTSLPRTGKKHTRKCFYLLRSIHQSSH